MAMMIDKETKEAAPVTAFLNMDQLAKDRGQGQRRRPRQVALGPRLGLALLRNYDPFKAPTHFKITDMMKKFDKSFGATGKNYGTVKGDRTIEDIEKRRADRWNFLFIAGMWFQDLFNYDFRRTEQCIIPYATQEGEISFCAYNTGVGWRNIIEKMHMTATLTKWYEEHGRHEIFAGGKKVGMSHVGHDLALNMEHVNSEANHTLDNLGIAKNAREEKIRARDSQAESSSDAENARMAKLYREHVLGEKPVEGLVSLDSIAPAKPAILQMVEPIAGELDHPQIVPLNMTGPLISSTGRPVAFLPHDNCRAPPYPFTPIFSTCSSSPPKAVIFGGFEIVPSAAESLLSAGGPFFEPPMNVQPDPGLLR